MIEKITLIIPLRLTAGTHEGALRLQRLCATVPRDLFDILISDYGTEHAEAGPIREAAASGVEVVRHPSPARLFSIGHARDFGVQMARRRIVIFNDIDFLATPAMYRSIHAEAMRRNLAANMFDFFCVPVLFLTEEGTRNWFTNIEQGREFIERPDLGWLESAQSDIQFTAFGSSAMVVNRHHYLALGGHDPKFSGHGAEDYDLLHRLASLAPRGPRPNEYFRDFKDNGVRNYWGFRPFFALHGLDVFARGINLVHLWHPRRAEKGYFRSAPNFRHLRNVMLRFERRGEMPLPLGDLTRSDRWLVFYRTPRDMMLIRQLLPFAGHYRLARMATLPAAFSLARLVEMAEAEMVLIAPDVRGDPFELAAQPSLAEIPVLLIRESDPIGKGAPIRKGGTTDGFELVRLCRGKPPVVAPAMTQASRSERGRVLFQRWSHIELDADTVLDSGDIPPAEPLTSPIFASFGGETLLDKALHPRPARKKKSSLWVRLKRRITGY